MEEWKAAFKQIFGRSPNKEDFSVAPKSIKALLPASPKKAPRGQKRKQLTLRYDEKKALMVTPPKRSRESRAAEKSPSKGREVDLDFLSPVKHWRSILVSPVKRAEDQGTAKSEDWLKTPSPLRLVRRPIFHTNIGNLLTPEKASNSDVGEEQQSDAENEAADEVAAEEALDLGAQKSAKWAQRPKRQRRANPSGGANFVAINLRRRRFAPISKFGAKWRGKRRGKWAKGGARFGR